MLRDKIFINEIPVKAIIGVNNEERVNKQKLIISLTLFVDMVKAGEKDDVTKTVDYFKLVSFVEDYVGETKFELLEALAANIAQKIFLEFNVLALKVKIQKPKALKQTKKVGIEIYREK